MELKQTYQKEIAPRLKEELGILNSLAVPKLVKIVVNVSLGEALADHKVLDRVKEQIASITGQKPVITKAKVSIASFKLRAGDSIGVKVTLRDRRMYVFLEKLTRIVLPRVRDFRGISKRGFDGRGNYNLGISEQIVFPEIDYAKIDKVRGLEITFVTTAGNDKHALELLKALGLPFEKEQKT